MKRVTRGPKGVPYAVTHDGRTVRYPDPDIKAERMKEEVFTKEEGYVPMENGDFTMENGDFTMDNGDFTVERNLSFFAVGDYVSPTVPGREYNQTNRRCF